MDGKIVKVFYSEKSASEYAEKNHDALMKNKIKADEGLTERYGMRPGGNSAGMRQQNADARNMAIRARDNSMDDNREAMLRNKSQTRRVNRLSKKMATGLPQRILNPQQAQAPEQQS